MRILVYTTEWCGYLPCDRQGLVQVLRRDHVVAADDLLGLGERAPSLTRTEPSLSCRIVVDVLLGCSRCPPRSAAALRETNC